MNFLFSAVFTNLRLSGIIKSFQRNYDNIKLEADTVLAKLAGFVCM